MFRIFGYFLSLVLLRYVCVEENCPIACDREAGTRNQNRKQELFFGGKYDRARGVGGLIMLSSGGH